MRVTGYARVMAVLGSLRAKLSRAVAAPEDLDSEALKSRVATVGAVPIAQAVPGTPCVLSGVLTSITVHPAGSTHGLEAELFDGTGRIRLIWMGRGRIGGISPGRSVTVEGRLVRGRQVPTMFNPRYSLWPHGESA
jgi:hypothetical protein